MIPSLLALFCRMSLSLGILVCLLCCCFFSDAFLSLDWGYAFLAEYHINWVVPFLACNIGRHVKSACLVVVTLIQCYADKYLNRFCSGEKPWFVTLANFHGAQTPTMVSFKLLSCHPRAQNWEGTASSELLSSPSTLLLWSLGLWWCLQTFSAVPVFPFIVSILWVDTLILYKYPVIY